MNREELGSKIKAIIRKAYPYGWAPYLLEDIQSISKGSEKKTINAYVETKLQDESTSKEEFIVLAILLYQKGGKKYKALASFIHAYLRNRLHSNDIYFLVHALFPNDYIPLPRSLVYDITERLLLNIESMYKKIVRDFQKVPVQNVNQVVLYLTMQYCRKDLNTQNQEMIALILSHIEADVPGEITNDVKHFLVRTFLQEITRSQENVQLNKQLYEDLQSYSQDEQKHPETQPKGQDESKVQKEDKKEHASPQKDERSVKTEQSQEQFLPQEDTWRHRGTQKNEKEDKSSSPFPEPTGIDASPTESSFRETDSTPSQDLPSIDKGEDSIERQEEQEATGEGTDKEAQNKDKKKPTSPDVDQKLFQPSSESDSTTTSSVTPEFSKSMSSKAKSTYKTPPPPQEPIDSGENQQQLDDKFIFTYAELKEENIDGIKLKDIDLNSLMEEKDVVEKNELNELIHTDENEGEKPDETVDEHETVINKKEKKENRDFNSKIEMPQHATEEIDKEDSVPAVQRKPEKRKKRLIGIIVGVLLITSVVLIVTLNSEQETSNQQAGLTTTDQTESIAEENASDADPDAESISTTQETTPSQEAGIGENRKLSTNRPEQIPTNSQRLVLENDGTSHTFYIGEEQVWWEVAEGDYFYNLFQFFQNYPPTDFDFVNRIKSLTWSYYFLRLRRYNPQLEDLDIILPDGVYVIATLE